MDNRKQLRMIEGMREMPRKEPVERRPGSVKENDPLLFDNWMTVSEFAEHLKFCRSYVYQLMEQGLPYLELGGEGAKKGARRVPVRRASDWLERRMKP